MSDIEQFKIEVAKYGDIQKFEQFHDGTEMVVRNKTGRQTTYTRLYETILSQNYNLVDSCFEPSYYKAYYSKK